MWIEIYAVLMILAGIYAALNVTLNHRLFRKLRQKGKAEGNPLISILVPSRNEEENLPHLLDSLLVQDYENIEILVIDDQSSDDTWRIMSEYAAKDERVRIFRIGEEDRIRKNGKINALITLVSKVRGKYIISTDADTVFAPGAVSYAYRIIEGNNLDLISGFPKEYSPSFWGSISMSAMMLVTVLVPQFMLSVFRIPRASFAIGQFVMMRKSAYDETGGYENVNTLCDDMGIARLFSEHRKRTAFISISDYISCNMYSNAKDAFNGITRSISGILPPSFISVILLLILVVVLLHLALAPIAFILLFVMKGLSMPILSIIGGYLLFLASWYIDCRGTGWERKIAIFPSFSLIAMILMYLKSTCYQLMGRKFEWKGRKVS